MPSHVLTLTDTNKTITVTSSSLVPIESELMRKFIADLTTMDNRVTLTSFELTPIVGFTNKFLYKFVAEDTRVWEQTIKMTNNVPMTFNVGEPGWELEEFSLQRPIRETVITLLRDFGCESIVVTFF